MKPEVDHSHVVSQTEAEAGSFSGIMDGFFPSSEARPVGSTNWLYRSTMGMVLESEEQQTSLSGFLALFCLNCYKEQIRTHLQRNIQIAYFPAHEFQLSLHSSENSKCYRDLCLYCGACFSFEPGKSI